MPIQVSVVSIPSIITRFSAPVDPSMAMPPALRSSFAPGACAAIVVKSRPRGSRSNTSLEKLVARIACVIARRGEPATTSTRSAMPAGRSVRSIVTWAPSTSATSATLAVSNPSSRAALQYSPGGSAGYRYPPAASVTITSARPLSLEIVTARAREDTALHVADDALDGSRLLLACYRCRCEKAAGDGGRNESLHWGPPTSITDVRRIPPERCHRHAGTSAHPGNGPGSRTYPVDDAALGTALRFVWLRSQVSSASCGRRCGGGFETASGTGQTRMAKASPHAASQRPSGETRPSRWRLQRRAADGAVRPTRVKRESSRRRHPSPPASLSRSRAIALTSVAVVEVLSGPTNDIESH